MSSAELILSAQRCGQCLTTRNRIVSGERAAEIIRKCRRENNHFVCHKSPPGQIVHCRGVHELGPSKAYRFAVAVGIPVREIDMDALP
jgi:hypothetical protein